MVPLTCGDTDWTGPRSASRLLGPKVSPSPPLVTSADVKSRWRPSVTAGGCLLSTVDKVVHGLEMSGRGSAESIFITQRQKVFFVFSFVLVHINK